jgi:membrane dipeptidase
VIQINYERSFIDQAYKDAYDKASGGVVAAMEKVTKECAGDEACVSRKIKDLETQMEASGALPRVSWEKIIEHIDHVVKLVGAEHVGLGSDFDGATMPDGMEDCSKLPRITEALMRKGYSDDDLRKILGGNILRVMEQNEKVSRELQAQ